MLWFCYELASLSWRWVEPSNNFAFMPSIEDSAVRVLDDQQSDNLKDVVQYHLFGAVAKAPKIKKKRAASKKVNIPVPVTPLNLTLRGLFTAGNGNSYALISSGRDGENIYKVGMSIAKGATIEAIHSDSVVINRGGNLEVLPLVEEVNPTSGKKSPMSRANRGVPTAREGIVSQTRYGDVRSKLLKDPQSAMRLLKVQPVMKEGKMMGYRLNPGNNPALFAEVGLQPGDLVKEVNGIGVGDPAKAGDLLNLLTNARQLEVMIERKGRLESLSITF